MKKSAFRIMQAVVMPVLVFLPVLSAAQGEGEKTRLIILADMGNEPDEEQQMVHMLMCSNEFELEGLIAVTGKWLRPEHSVPYKRVVHPELFLKLIEAYGQVLPNLALHAGGYPDPDYLRSIAVSGQSGYGIEDTGEGKSSEGSRLIARALEKDDPRPLYVVVNAGSNTLAQALKDYERTHTEKELHEAVASLRVFENSAQDNAGAWICNRYPDMHWVRSNHQTNCYGGRNASKLGPHTWEPYAYSFLGQHQWALEHIVGGHGPLGSHWPMRTFHGGGLGFVEGGGTVPWLGLVSRGLSDVDHPWWGGWSGRFTREKVKNDWSRYESVEEEEQDLTPFYTYGEAADTWTNPEDGITYRGDFVPVWRWRRAFFNDFKCRMDWCVLPYGEANHHPVAVVNGDGSDRILRMEVDPGLTAVLDAEGSSDPDGDPFALRWWCYREAGTYDGVPGISSPTAEKITVKIPGDAGGKEIHIILEVQDLNRAGSLWDYRRIVISVTG